MGAKFTCQFSIPDDNWYDDNGEIADYSTQVAETLRGIQRLVRIRDGGVIRDVNGNKIGSWKLR